VTATNVASCPYSDHDFILAAIETVKDKFKPEIFWSRNLSGNNIKQIEEGLKNINYSKIDEMAYSNEKWLNLKHSILSIHCKKSI